MKCTDCIHFEVCCYVDPNLPVCDSFVHQKQTVKLPYPVGEKSYLTIMLDRPITEEDVKLALNTFNPGVELKWVSHF